MVTEVLPHIYVDLISYSAYDSTVDAAVEPIVYPVGDLTRALDYIAAHANDSEYFGNKNVYVGEFGIPENVFDKSQIKFIMTNTIKTSLDWGCPYILYWKL